MQPYVMFGTHFMFGNYADAIHANGGVLTGVVVNMAEPERPAGDRFEDRLAQYMDWRKRAGIPGEVEVLALEDFRPSRGERYVFGFRGVKALPLRDHLREAHGLTFAPLIHPTAYVSPMSELGDGVFVGAGAVISPRVTVGDLTLVSTRAVIGHDSVIGAGCVLTSCASLSSRVTFEDGVVAGINSTVIEHVTVGEGAFIAAGAVVLRNVAARTLVAGVPAVEKRKLA